MRKGNIILPYLSNICWVPLVNAYSSDHFKIMYICVLICVSVYACMSVLQILHELKTFFKLYRQQTIMSQNIFNEVAHAPRCNIGRILKEYMQFKRNYLSRPDFTVCLLTCLTFFGLVKFLFTKTNVAIRHVVYIYEQF